MTTPPTALSDPSLYQDGEPEPLWAALRASAPVHRLVHDGAPYWAVVGHREITQVLRDPATFVSARGMRLDHNPAATALAAGKMLIITDPPRHAKLRRIITASFTPKMAARLEHNMRATVRRALDRALDAATCDFADIAAELPVSVICDLLGVPPADWDFMLRHTRIAFGSAGADELAMAEAHVEIMAYYQDLVARRRREPADDLITALVTGTVDGAPLTDEEVFLNCDGLISGGNETTRHATIGGLLALIQHPDQWQALRDHPELLPRAVQEILRWTSPAMHVLRTAAARAELAGHAIEPGDRIALWLPAGNRDPAVFADPERFDVARQVNPHLAFATGNHHCLGAALATTELQVMFGEIVRRVGDARPAGPVRRTRSILIWGFDALPVALTPRSAA